MKKNDVRVMGVLNVTPDSFYDGGLRVDASEAVAHAIKMVESGASILDVGGESTRPGAKEVGIDEELGRVIPVIEALTKSVDVSISIDTSKAVVMREAVNAGATMVNDVFALRQPGALMAAAELGVPVCLMHMQGSPRSMQHQPNYVDVEIEVVAFLRARIKACLAAGIKLDNIILDPGFGFGKSLAHNLTLMRKLKSIVDIGVPVLVGVSRKSMLSEILNAEVDQRLVGSLALATIAIMEGASIVRVHDVEETVQVVKVCDAVMNA